MKFLDKFLKFLKTDRNTFFTYILTVLTIYFVVDRVVEIMLMVITGVSASYWGPIQYTLAIACPIFAFLFSGSSSFVKADQLKLSFFYLYCTIFKKASISKNVITRLQMLIFINIISNFLSFYKW